MGVNKNTQDIDMDDSFFEEAQRILEILEGKTEGPLFGEYPLPKISIPPGLTSIDEKHRIIGMAPFNTRVEWH